LGIIWMMNYSGLQSQNCNWVVTVDFANPSCPGSGDGGAEIIINGNVATLNQADYLWSTQWDMPTIDNLVPGNYSVTINDQPNHCIEIISFTITDPIFPATQVSVTPATDCVTGSVTIQVPGVEEYSIKWNDNVKSGPTRTDMAAGTYGYELYVGWCSETGSVTVPQGQSLGLTLSSNDLIIDHPGEIITVHSNVTGGTSPYFFSWFEAYSLAVVSTSPNLNIDVPGCYFLEVMDANGCNAITEVCIKEDDYKVETRSVKASQPSQSFPNPASSVIQIPLGKGKNRISLQDISGKILQSNLEDAEANKQIPMNLNTYPEGIYILKVSNTDTQIERTEKIIVRK